MKHPIYKQVDKYIKYCEKVRRMSPQTMKSKRWVLQRFSDEIGVIDLKNLTNAQISRWVSRQTNRGVSGRTLNIWLAHIKAMLIWQVEMGMKMAVKMPLIPVVNENPPRRVFYTSEQIHRVLDVCDPLQWLLISITANCGLRLTELAELRLNSLYGRRISYIGKGNKRREGYITDEILERLTKYIEDNNITDYLWIRPKKRTRFTKQNLRYRMYTAFHKAGFDDFYPHALRHSFGTNLQRRGASLFEIQQMMGHANATTTERYLHGFDGQLGKLFDKYQNIV